MAISREEVLGWIEQASILEVNELVKDIEEKFGITAAVIAPVAVAGAPGAGAGAGPQEGSASRLPWPGGSSVSLVWLDPSASMT